MSSVVRTLYPIGKKQGCDRRRYSVIYVNVIKIDVVNIIFDFKDVK